LGNPAREDYFRRALLSSSPVYTVLKLRAPAAAQEVPTVGSTQSSAPSTVSSLFETTTGSVQSQDEVVK